MNDVWLIDTHCHLNLKEAFPDPESTIRECKEFGVTQFVVVGVDLETSRLAIELAESYSSVFATVGIHPNSAGEWNSVTHASIRGYLQHDKVVAIGEIGLDYYWDHTSPLEQMACLNGQLELADELKAPVVVHCRDAWDELLDRLSKDAPRRYQFHCFSGTQRQAERCLELGGWLGFDGPITYKKNSELREIAAWVPADRILIETDSPYLSPEPVRGKPNSPKNLALVNSLIASLRGCTEKEMAEITAQNARNFFGLP